jgi:hypothetical protein
MMEARVQRVLIWTGPAMIVLWVGAFLFIAGFIPPSAPKASAADIVALYKGCTNAIKLGMVISMAGSALLVPWAVAIWGQLKRIKGAKALADTQMVFVRAAVVGIHHADRHLDGGHLSLRRPRRRRHSHTP